MPIRMTDDDSNDSRDDSGSRDRDSGGGGGGNGAALMGCLSFAFRHPILTLVLVVAVGLAALFSEDEQKPARVAEGGGNRPGQYGFGATLDREVYDEVLVHEPLSAPPPSRGSVGEDGLPVRVSLRKYAPARRSQGHQGSCVGWSTSYAARTILQAKATGERPDDVAFSPSFLYNPIALEGCNGTYMKKALERLKTAGDLPFSEFAYDVESCDAEPSGDQAARAKTFRIRGYDRLSEDADEYVTNVDAIRQHLAQEAPVVIGMMVGGTFERGMQGKRVWIPTDSDYAREGDWGGHAMTAIGYDDALEGGAIEIMNSWGTDWGQDGIAFVRYEDFPKFVDEAYGLHSLGSSAPRDSGQTIRFGFVDNASKERLPLAARQGVVFRTVDAITAGTRFKVEFQNTRPTYTYIFGEETDGSSYVLFPYSDKHDPYCGTTGTRLFPRKQSLEADDKGERDSIAVVIASEPLDYRALNVAITSSAGGDYEAKLLSALGDKRSTKARTRVKDDLVELTASGTEADKVHALVIEFDKTSAE